MKHLPVLPTRRTDALGLKERAPMRRAGELSIRFMAVAALLFGTACSEEETASHDDLDPVEDFATDEAGAEQNSLGITESKAREVLAGLRKTSSGLPLYESRPGARVAIYLDFDGGTYEGSSRESFGPATLDSDEDRFNSTEQMGIVRAALEVAKTYSGFNVNVTTSDEARRRSSKWTWILITSDWDTSGKGRIGSVGTSSYAKAVAGAEAVFSPPSSQRGYLLTHEIGHTFGLNHTGVWKSGRYTEWSDLKSSRVGDWLGGRSSYFTSYTWMRLQTEVSDRYQDPRAVIGGVAGFVN